MLFGLGEGFQDLRSNAPSVLLFLLLRPEGLADEVIFEADKGIVLTDPLADLFLGSVRR